MSDLNEYIWNEVAAREGRVFTTDKGKPFSYHLKRTKHGEMLGAIVIDGSSAEITRSTLLLALHEAIDIQKRKGCVSRPGQLGTYGSRFLYPVCLDIGICSARKEDAVKINPEDIPAAESYGSDAGQQPETGASVTDTPAAEPAGKKCSNCGYIADEDFVFCPKCGTKLDDNSFTSANI